MTKRRLIAKFVVFLAVATFLAAVASYFIARKAYLEAAHAAFPKLPIDSRCYFIPWPAGPVIYGGLEPDDPSYLGREFINKSSNGLRLEIADSDGTFMIKPE